MILLKVVYISSVFVSLLLVGIVFTLLRNNKYLTIKGKQVQVKFPYTVMTILVVIAFLPIINTIIAYKLMCKILT